MPLPTDKDGAIDWTAATVQASQQSRAEEVRNSVSQALPVNPDTEAQLRRDASAARIPLPAARALPDVTRVQAQMSQFDADIIARKFPSTAQMLANPDLARIAHDDIPKTTEVEQHATALAGRGFMGPTEPTLLERAKTPDFWTGIAKYLFSANDGKDNLTSDVGSAATALSGKIGEGAALAAGGALVVVGAGGTKAQDAVFGVAKHYGDQAEGEGEKPGAFHNKLVKSAATLGLQLPMMMAGGGAGPMLEAGATGTATLTKYLGDAVIHGTKAMSMPALTDSIDMMHKVYAKTGDMGAAARAGLAQYAFSTAGGIVPLNAPGGIAARTLAGTAAGTVQGELSRQGMNAVLPDTMQTPFNLEDAAVSGVVGGLTAGVMGPRPETNRNAAVRAFNDAYAAALGEHRNEQIVALGKAAAQSKLRERDPAAFHQFIEDTVNQGDAPKGLFIDAHQLASVLEAHGITGDELHQTMPEVAAQLEHATGDTAPSNGLVQIPIADFATHIAGSPLEEPLLQHLRVDPGGGSVAESKAYHQSQAADLAKQAERLTAANAGDQAYQASLDKVHTDLHARLQAIGMTPDIAAANAAPLAAFYQVHADRMGILPHEMAERYPVRFSNEALHEGSRFDQTDHPAAALLHLGRDESLYQYPKSKATDPVEIARDKSPGLKVTEQTITQGDGTEKSTGIWHIVTPTHGFGEMTRRGNEVFINVAGLKAGDAGSLIYDLAANYAVNNGLKFIGDPAGVSKAAMVRRNENMLSSAVKYGTTDHLAPHAAQLKGDKTVPALRWTDGDTFGNIRSMMEASVAANRKLAPASEGITYDHANDRFVDSEGQQLDAHAIRALANLDRAESGAGAPGRTTLQRVALLHTLLSNPDGRRELLGRVRGVEGDGSAGTGGALEGSFYQRNAQVDTPAFKAWSHDHPLVELDESHEFKDGEGVVVEALHGTTGDFTVFDRSAANIESDLGGGFYFTNSREDVGHNYAGFGPDLTQKIELLAERIEQEADGALDMDAARKQARDKFAAHEGATLPVFVRFDKPVVLGGERETFLDYEEGYNHETEEFEGEPTGALVKFIDALRDIAGDERYGDMDADKTIGDIMEKAVDNGGLKASELIEIAGLSEGLVYVADYEQEGKLASKEILRKAFEAAGYDGFIDQTVNVKFGSERDVGQSMKGMGEDTVHYIAFEPTQIKSSIGNSGAFDASNPDILKQQSRGTFSPTTKTITQLKGADLSTFQHELGHFFLDTLSHLALDPNAPASVKADMHTLLAWGDVPDLDSWHKMSVDEQRALHEKFATAWETYLMRGEAPSLDMRSLFSRFRSWMLNVYKSLKGAPGEYTPEVRGVFDRMIASEDAIAQAEQARRYMPLFDTPEKSAMTPEEWTAYQALGKDATEQAVEALTGKTLKDMAWMDRLRTASLKAVTKDAAEKRAAIVNEVKAEVMAQPIYRAWSFLTGKVEKREGAEAKTADATTGAGKLNTEALKAAFGEEVAAKLYELKMTGKKGIDPNVVADMFGFPDAAALVKALVESEPPKSVVEGMSDQRMLERHGEIADPQAMQRTADELVHNEVRARFVATEFKALKKATGSAKDIANAAKEAANNAIDTRRIRDISAAQYDAAETRSARAAEQAMAKGDTAGAAAAKRDQILSMQLARAARDAQAYVEKAVTYLKKFDTPSTREAIDLEYRDQIDALLDRADLRKSVTNKSLDRREALQAFVERLSGEGFKPQIPESLLDEAQRWHYKDMPLAAFKGLVDSVKSIEHLGKLKSKLIDGQETREIQALAEEVQATAAELPQQKAESNRGLSRIDKAWIATKAFGRSAQASMLKIEQMLDWLDARNPNGTLNRVVFKRLSDAGIKEAEMLKAMKTQIGALVDSHIADITKERGKIYVADGLIDGATGLPQRFTTKEMLMLAGNMGNESNAAKMAKGEKWDQAEVWAFLRQNMTKAHWDFVAGMGRALESLWPEKLAMDRRLGNTSPEKIEPRPFDTPHGSYEGWYWPLMYDPARAQDVAERGARQGDAMFENIYAKANTDTGRMNTRNENYARPLLLDLDALPRMIKDEIHDITYREAVIDADRFLSHPTVRKAIVSALSQEHYDQLRPWLQSIANDGKTSTDGARGMEFFNTIAREARTRATMVGLGLRLTTALVHGSTAASESVSELGAKWMGAGLKDFANPGQWAANKDFVFERSGEMRNRMNEVDRDVRENLREIDLRMMDPTTGALTRGADLMRAHAYSLIAGLDMASALPTWMGAYKKALTPEDRGGLGYSEDEAIYFADKTVRNAHGGTGIKDMARVQRGTEFQKLFTMFYTFWNHNINRIVDTNKLVFSPEHRAMLKDQNNWSTTQLASTVILRTLAYTFGVQAIHSLINPPKKEDDGEHWATWAAKELAAAAFAGIPIARDISAHYLTGRDYSVTPAASMVDAVGKSGQDALNVLTGKSVSDKWLKHAITTAGYATSLPLGQPASTAQFLWDLGAGKAHPSTAKEWWAGVAHGDIHAHH